MSEHTLVPSDIVCHQQSDRNIPSDDDEIIDVSTFNMTDDWLYMPTHTVSGCTVHDLYTWLRSEPESDLQTLIGNKKCVDTRTFTRPKKRSNRMSFESIVEALATPLPPIPMSQTFEVAKNEVADYVKAESIPAMLKSTAMMKFSSNDGLKISGQESMEAFLNMSASKGIDSFINLTEPEFSDDLMNESQPSMLYETMSSLTRDTTLSESNYQSGIHLKCVTGTGNVQKVMNLTSVKQTHNNFVLPNNCTTYPLDETFVNTSDIKVNVDLNNTYAAKMLTKENAQEAREKDVMTNTVRSAIVSQLLTNNPLHTSRNVHKQDITINDINDTIVIKKESKCEVPVTGVSTGKQTGAYCRINANCLQNNLEIPSCACIKDTNTILDSTFQIPDTISALTTIKTDCPMNSTFKTHTSQLNHYQSIDMSLNTRMKVPTALRKELLTEIERNNTQELNSTYNHVGREHFLEEHKIVKKHPEAHDKHRNENIACTQSKYNTYRKNLSQNPHINLHNIENSNIMQTSTQTYLADPKLCPDIKKPTNSASKPDVGNMESDKIDVTFRKPVSKLMKKKSRMVSRLPQCLQRSNPNLISNSLKTVHSTDYDTSFSNAGYIKGSEPDILQSTEKAVTNKLYSIGKLKSGSDQRLLEMNINAADFQMAVAGGSTESIESTQSAHSAPDLDDRLSVCSDSSHNSFSVHTMNIEQLHKIVKMQEESLQLESTPKHNKRVLTNTWREEKKHSRSPNSRNGVQCYESGSSSPYSIDSTVVTSSPILSSNGSSQSINDDNQKDSVIRKHIEQVAVKEDVVRKPFESKTRLRPPTNWNGGNKPLGMPSGIPRLSSRIPAPRLVRPNAKAIQGDVKRGYL